MKTRLFARFGFCLAMAFVCAPVNIVFADKVFLSVTGQYGPAGLLHKVVTSGAGSVSAANSDSTWSLKGTTSMGRVDLDLTAIDGTDPYNGFASESGYWINTITILPENPALMGTPGTAVFTYHLSGSQFLNRYGISDNTWVFTSDQNNGFIGRDYGNGTYYGQHISDEATFTVTRSFTFGGSVFEQMSLGGTVDLESESGGEGKLHLSLVTGAITVLDNAGHSVAYSSTSSAGVARATIFANGNSYAGFSVTNNLGNQTVLSLLGGANAAGSNETVAVTFTGSPDTNQIISDVADLSSSVASTVTNFVVQMSYDPAKAIASLGGEKNALLVWFNQAANKWVNVVEGNSDGGLVKHFLQGAYNQVPQPQRGDHGVDTNNHVAWAVVDHHSQFAVGVVTPPLQFAGISAGTSGTTLMLSGPPTGQFFIDYSSSLVAPGWTLLGLTTLGTNGTSIFNDATSILANPQRFYRARQ